MKKQHLIVCLMLAFVLICASCANIGSNNTQTDRNYSYGLNIKQFDGSYSDDASWSSIAQEASYFKADDRVWVIVEVEGTSVASKLLGENNSDIQSYLLSEEGIAYVNELKAGHDSVKALISEEEIAATYKYSYTTLVNGFAVELRYGDIAKVRAMSGVKSVTIAEEYAVPDTSVEEITELVQSSGIFSNNSEYQGQGMVVAVIDTGVDYKLDAFKSELENPSIKKSDVESFINAVYGSGSVTMSADQAYYSSKVPFMFDYADMNIDAMPTGYSVSAFGGYHGTHVAGIITGNDSEITGVAPEAQLIPMKVFPDNSSSGAKTVDIIAALSDCAVIGVDAVNMSLGSSAGFSYEGNGSYIDDMYELLGQLGIQVIVSAGNSYSSQVVNKNGKVAAENPDYGVVGSPSSYGTSLSVASVDAYVTNVFMVNSTKYAFYMSVDSDNNANEFYSLFDNEINLELVVVPGIGAESDYEGLDVEGKAVLVMRGDISFEEKHNIAAAHGAAMCIVYNTEANTSVRPVINELKIPTISITLEGATSIILLAEKTDINVYFNVDYSLYTMSSFSSWGCTPDLGLKPEITGFGGEIYSCMPSSYSSKYAYLSGTSMAAPNIAGLSLALRQYVKESNPSMTNKEIQTLVYNLMLSTATVVDNMNGNPASPREQGAGVANLDAALTTKAYLSVTGKDRPTLELGHDSEKTGVYTLKFNLVNMSDEELSYSLYTSVLTDHAENGYITLTSDLLEEATVKYYVDGEAVEDTVVVGANETVKIKVVIRLSENEMQMLDETFVNGIYIEGFCCLTPDDETQPVLSIPYLSFYGDWADAQVIDNTIFDDDYYVYPMTIVGSYNDGYYMGDYQYVMESGAKDVPHVKEKIALSQAEGANNTILGVYSALLRNARQISYSVVDPVTGYIYYRAIGSNVRKAYYNNGTLVFAQHGLSIDSRDYSWENNQELVFVMDALYATEDGREIYDVIELPLYIDNEAPTVNSVELVVNEGKTYLKCNIFDNRYLNELWLFKRTADGELTQVCTVPYPVYEWVCNSDNEILLDITDYVDSFGAGEEAVLMMHDSAFNQTYYTLGNLNEAGNAASNVNSYPTTTVNIDGETVVVAAGDLSDVKYKVNSTEEAKYTVVAGTLVAYEGPLGDLVIPDNLGITAIGESCFENAFGLTSVVIPEGVETIGVKAFSCCYYMTNVVIPSTLTKIGDYAFMNNYDLVTINLEDAKITSYGSSSFFKAMSLKRVEIADPDGATVTIMKGVFRAAISMEELIVHANVKISGNAFYDLYALKTAKFYGNFTGVTNYLFNDSDMLESIEFFGNLGTIGNSNSNVYAFVNQCDSLKEVIFHGNVGNIKTHFFTACPALEKVVFYGSVGDLGTLAFTGSYALKHFTVGEGNEYMVYDEETGIMYDKAKTKMYMPPAWDYEGELVVPETVTSLRATQFGTVESFQSYNASISFIHGQATSTLTTTGYQGAYYEKSGLKSVVLPAKITSVPNYCFRGNTGIENITFNSGSCKSVGSYSFYGCKSLTEYPLTQDATSIGTYAFRNCESLESAFIPAKVTTIPTQSFSGCTSLSSVEVHNNVKIINASAFNGTVALESLDYMPNLTSIAGYAFQNSGIREFSFPESLTLIKLNAFENSKLQKINFGSKLATIETAAFQNCKDLVAADMSMSAVKAIADYTFYGCSSLETVFLPNGLVSVGSYAFANCGLKEVNLPETFESFDVATSFAGNAELVAFNAPENAESISSVDGILFNKDKSIIYIFPAAKEVASGEYTLPETVEYIADSAFASNRYLKTVNIANVSQIGSYAFENAAVETILGSNLIFTDVGAFYNAANLKTIDLSHMEAIYDYAFAGTALTELSLADNLEYIGEYAFANCEQLKSLHIGTHTEAFNYSYVFYGVDFEEITVAENADYFKMSNSLLMSANGKVIYDTADNSIVNLVIEEGVVRIASFAFEGMESIETIEFSSTVAEIGDRAFYGCTSLTDVTFKSEVAPRLLGAYNANYHYNYANFIGHCEEVAPSIRIHCGDDASFRTIIWKKIFIFD